MDLHTVLDIQKLRWPLTVIIVVEVLLLILLALYKLGLLNAKLIVTWLVDNVAGQLIVLIIMLLIGYYFIERKKEVRRIKREDERLQNEKRILKDDLLSETEVNQNFLKPLSDTTPNVFERYDELLSDNKLPNELAFNRYIYSKSFDKFELLNDESRELIRKYYPELDYIENKYTKFKNIHGASYSDLRYLMVQYQTNEIYNQPKNKDSVQKWPETEEFLRHTKKVYDLGDELIKSMKDK